MMEDYEIILTSYENCDYFVVEIWFQNILIAIVNENSELKFFNDETSSYVFESREFMYALNKAKKKLNII